MRPSKQSRRFLAWLQSPITWPALDQLQKKCQDAFANFRTAGIAFAAAIDRHTGLSHGKQRLLEPLHKEVSWPAVDPLQEKYAGAVASYRNFSGDFAETVRAHTVIQQICAVANLPCSDAWKIFCVWITKRLGQRSLIGEILALQFGFALLAGALAIWGLWWSSTWVIDDNLQDWGKQWIEELDDLGMPLYVSQDEDKFLKIEKYVNAFPAISFVRYYSESGEVVFKNIQHDQELDIIPLDSGYLRRLASRPTAGQPFLLDTPVEDLPLVRISKPIWTQSLSGDGLLQLDLEDDQNVNTTLVGFVELGLDFSSYQAQVAKNIRSISLLGVSVLIFLVWTAWFTFRHALRPLSDLQRPLRKLAQGSTDFTVEPSGHREIDAITNALNATVTALQERDEKLWQIANRDPLTGLTNRHKFSELLVEEIAGISRNSSTSALLFVDLDQFKYVNDTLGHVAGDQILKQAAERLKNSVRKNDVVSRFGGDEFTILLTRVTRKDVRTICEGIVHDMREHSFVEGGERFRLPCSVGIAMIDSDRFSAAELLAHADMACHDAKARGRNRFQYYKVSGKEMKQMSADVGWAQQIKKSLKDDSFVLLYQPIVEIKTGHLAMYEVLLRMRSEGTRLIPPTAFLPAASRFGLMPEIDQWVIRNALGRLGEFRDTHKDVRFALNISGNIFEDTDLYRRIDETLKDNHLSPDSLVLEITEQIAVRNIVKAAKQIKEIKELGCKFAIDDFGSGHSSYTYLKGLPVDYIKIDGSFIQNLTSDVIDRTIVSSIAQIAKGTDKQTIAEHVEDAATVDLLRELGVDYAQGFYVGKPFAAG